MLACAAVEAHDAMMSSENNSETRLTLQRPHAGNFRAAAYRGRGGGVRERRERMVDPRVSVSYEVVPGGEADWSKISTEVLRQLPLRNLHWKSSNRSIRTIQELTVNFKPLSALEGKHNSSLFERPYAHLLFVLCDVSLPYRLIPWWSRRL